MTAEGTVGALTCFYNCYKLHFRNTWCLVSLIPLFDVFTFVPPTFNEGGQSVLNVRVKTGNFETMWPKLL
jgi:hypothetical protein